MDAERPTELSIRDVTPRDGLQSAAPIDTPRRILLAHQLADAGLVDIEAASFVSPTAVPAMAHATEVFAGLDRRRGVTWWALVPNRRGVQLARAAGCNALTVTISASDAYSHKNLGRSTEESLRGLAGIVEAAGAARLDVVVSCAFGSPFGDVTETEVVDKVLAAMARVAPNARLTLADTTGTATPRRIARVVDAVPAALRADLGLHLHDSRGLALANALAGIGLGITRFDTAVGGLGGSPFAPAAGGNLATEQLAVVAEDLGMHTGVDVDQLIALARSMEALVGHPVPSRVAQAGRLEEFDS